MTDTYLWVKMALTSNFGRVKNKEQPDTYNKPVVFLTYAFLHVRVIVFCEPIYLNIKGSHYICQEMYKTKKSWNSVEKLIKLGFLTTEDWTDVIFIEWNVKIEFTTLPASSPGQPV